MIKYNELKKGDYVLAESDGQAWQGEVTNFNNDEKEISVYNGVQDFYFKAEDLYPLPLSEEQLMKLKFQKHVNEDGSVKYMKGAFRIQTPSQDNFSNFDLWYRDEKRIMLQPISVHQLQNHHLKMTKVHLTDDVI
ncbi:MAG TPA: hypothetical protein VGP55_03430 [Chitinophagaceae bacterium]|nr:hypothetical protein [Chitinophagaceae bacterium]